MTKLILGIIGLTLLPLLAITTAIGADRERDTNPYRIRAFRIEPYHIDPIAIRPNRETRSTGTNEVTATNRTALRDESTRIARRDRNPATGTDEVQPTNPDVGQTTSVPEPGIGLLLALGLVGLAGFRKKLRLSKRLFKP